MKSCDAKSWHNGGSRISFLLRLSLVAMVCGIVVAGYGDRGIRSFTTAAHGSFLPAGAARPLAKATPAPLVTCKSGPIDPGDGSQDLAVIGPCTVSGGLYQYQNVNIYKDVASGGDPNGGSLTFQDAKGAIDFWANSILVENNGELIAGAQTAPFVGPLTIHLYGLEQNKGNSGLGGVGIACKTPISPEFPFCGIPKALWDSNPNPTPDS
jgi:hypothetical protein